MSGVPEEYHEFADVFSKTRADILPEHRPYDLKITLEDGAVSVHRMYPLGWVNLADVSGVLTDVSSPLCAKRARHSRSLPSLAALGGSPEPVALRRAR